jgi:hypothetical protein
MVRVFQPGVVGWMPNRYHGMMKPGEADHTWLQVKFGFSSGVHASWPRVSILNFEI